MILIKIYVKGARLQYLFSKIFENGNKRRRKKTYVNNNSDNLFEIVFKAFHYDYIDNSNNTSKSLSDTTVD